MRLSRNVSKFYVRPIFSRKKSNSILLGSSKLYFSEFELIERNKNKIKKKVISLSDIEILPQNIAKIVKEKIKTIKKPLSKASRINFKNQ